MKLKHLLCIVFLTTTGIALAQAQTTKQSPQTKAPTPAAHKNPAQQLPFADARNMTVIIPWAPAPHPPLSPGMPSMPGGMPVAIGSGVWLAKQGYIATCQHVIGNRSGPFKIGIAREPYVTAGGAMNISIMGAVNLIAADLVASDPDTDVAILKAQQTPDQVRPGPLVSGNVSPSVTPQTPISPKGAALNTDFPQRGETLLVAGFPIPENTPNTLVLQTGVATGFFSNPHAANSPPASALRIMLSLVSNPGNSGGPVLDAMLTCHAPIAAAADGLSPIHWTFPRSCMRVLPVMQV
jgi:S1-C subfamily serine protease